MAREQGDDLGNEVLYVHPDHPEFGDRPAYTPVDVVNLEARGWLPKGKAPRRTPNAGPVVSPVVAPN